MNSHDILNLINNQLSSFWGEYVPKFNNEDLFLIDISLEKLKNCILKTNSRYNNVENFQIDITNSLQYMIFLYFLSNQLYKYNLTQKASSIYYLNKIFNSVELFYAIELPDIFYAEHPVGSVMGRANYGKYFFFYQGCTVGGNQKENEIIYPNLGDFVVMYSNSKIIGNCNIGNNVIIGANTFIKDTDIPSNSIVFGKSPNLVVKRNCNNLIKTILSHLWKVD